MRFRIAAAADSVVGRIERARGLDALSDRVAALGAGLKPGRMKDLLSGTPLGHPAHPVLVTVPIGAWITATYLDLVGGTPCRAAAQRAVGLGVAFAVPTVVTGFSDWLETAGAERRVGLVHAAVNDTAITLYGASLLARRAGRHRLGVGLAAAGSGILGVGGWLGGHLAYAQGVGVDTTAFQGAPSEWTDAGALDDIPQDRPAALTAAGVPLLVVRRDQTVRVLADRCTHRGAPLHEGELRSDCVVCPWHGSVFSLEDGRVERGPATRPQPAYDVRIVDGRIQVRRPDEQRSLRTNPAGV